MKPLPGNDWLQEMNWRIRQIEKTTKMANQSEKDKIFTHFVMLFRTNQTIKHTEFRIHLKPGHQRAIPIPCHLQSYVGKEKKNKLIQP